MFISLPSLTISGLDTLRVDIEINVCKRGMPGFEIIGLPNKAIVESRYRIKTAILNSGFEFPLKKIIVNLAPADLPKEGSFYDLPIALGILSTITAVKIPSDSLFFGEVSLDGKLRHTRGAFLFALYALEAGYKRLILPKSNAAEAEGVNGKGHKLDVIGVSTLQDLVVLLRKGVFTKEKARQPDECSNKSTEVVSPLDMSFVYGQAHVKRALEISSAGGHNIFISGPPGSGKSLLAKSFTTILPKLSDQELVEVTKIYSMAGKILPNKPFITTMPFRSPHSSTTLAGMLGGGVGPVPGEITLAHNGVLFMDEFPEFSRRVLEALRQPLEEKHIILTRGGTSVLFPSKFILVACANPCPCGFFGSSKKCICTPKQIELYKKRISGPLLDRIDMFVRTDVVKLHELNIFNTQNTAESSASILQRIFHARKLQEVRLKPFGCTLNSELCNENVKTVCNLSASVEAFLAGAMGKFGFSVRVYFKILKMARTIADLNGDVELNIAHIAEALHYRTQFLENI